MNTSEAPRPDSPLAACSNALADVVAHVGSSTLAVQSRRGTVASAAVWRQGLVVTAAHVFRRQPASVQVILPDRSRVDAQAVGIDVATDIAAFRLDEPALPSLVSAEAFEVRAGQWVIAVGRAADGDLTASSGVVNRVGGAWQSWLGGRIDRLIRLDGGLHDGLSGAPVVDAGGRLIGMATAALMRSHGIVVPTATVSSVLDALLSRGHVARAYLGLGGQPVDLDTDDLGQQGLVATSGLLISSLAPDGPAAKAGLRVGDIVVAVAGEPASSMESLRQALAGRVGEQVPVSLLRGGAARELSVEVGQWPREMRCC